MYVMLKYDMAPLAAVDLLNGSEARVLQALLAAGPESERERLRRLGLPRSTFHVARRKIYGQRWARDLYVPDPRALGFPYATVALGQPHVENWTKLGESWAGLGVAPLVWTSPTVTFAVAFHPDAESAKAAALRLEKSDARDINVVSTITDPLAFPVYFDYEGGWSKFAELPGLFGYPRPLAATERPYRSAGSPASGHERESMRSLLLEASTANAEGRPHPNSSPLLFPRAVQRMLRDDRVQHRVVPDFSRLPALRAGAIAQVVFFAGELAPGRTAPELMSALISDCQTYPFFFAHDRRKVIFLHLARTPAGGAAPPADPAARPTRPVLTVLQEHLRRIGFVREWLEQLQRPVDHEYERLLGSPKGTAVPIPGAPQSFGSRFARPRPTI